ARIYGHSSSFTAVLLERDRQPHAEVADPAVLDRHVLTDDLRDAQVAHGLARRLDGLARGGLPWLAAYPNDLGDAIDAVGHLKLSSSSGAAPNSLMKRPRPAGW